MVRPGYWYAGCPHCVMGFRGAPSLSPKELIWGRAMFNIHKGLSQLIKLCLILLFSCLSLRGQEISTDAWTILQAGTQDKNTDRRVQAVLALGLIPKDRRSVELAEQSLNDPRPEVRR